MRVSPRWRTVLLVGVGLGCRQPPPDQHPGSDSTPASAAADPANVVVPSPKVDSAVDTAAHANLRDFLPDGIEIRAGDSTLDERTVGPRSDFDAATTALLYFRIPLKLPVGTQFGVAGHHHCEISRAESDAVSVVELGIQLSTEGVSLGGATGLPAPGNWFPGHYRVSCSVDGRVIGSNFTVTGLPMKTDLNWVGHIPALGADVTQLSLFENDNPRQGDDHIGRVFSAATSRYIYISIGLGLPGRTDYPPTTVRCTFHRDDGTQIGAYEVVIRPDDGSRSRVFYEGYGNRNPGWWRPGWYFAECVVGHQRVVGAVFEVQP